jgi:hypothetical protein
MSYQAVIRNSRDQLVTNTQVGMQISILQGSANGSVVYPETQTPTANANGLICIEIGNGAGFSSINWTNGPYFLKIETDPTGGTNYTITGTSQLLSVPYALHAKTAEIICRGITETDPVYSASVSSKIIATDTTNWNNKNQLTAGTGIDITNHVISTTGRVTTYSVGDFAYGGIVFWVDETSQHGLVCAKDDQSTNVRWFAGTYGVTQAKGNGPFAGKADTSIIIAAQVAIGDDGSTYAARICNELQVTEGGKTYGDWYLPSKEELNLLYQNKATIDSKATVNGGSALTSADYWSSTEINSGIAWSQDIDSGTHCSNTKSNTRMVRAVRPF